MTEIEITQGQNIIDILYNDFASCLVIQKALAVNWPDCEGSIGEYYAISEFSVDERNFYTQTINQVLSDGTDEEQIEAIKDFLKLFANGRYSIFKHEAEPEKLSFFSNNNVVYSENFPQEKQFFGAFYPHYWEDFYPYIFSITNDKIDAERVDYYLELINSGKRPSILSFSVSNNLTGSYSCDYVLDGHHKIEAYKKLRVGIPIISIVKLNDGTNNTAELLKYSKKILKDFEYQHLFENSDDHLLSIDFINDIELTDDLDEFLKKSDRLDISIIQVLKKYSKTIDNSEYEWLQSRLISLKKNTHINMFGFGKGLKVYAKQKHEQYGEVWFPEVVKMHGELGNWIERTIKS